MSTPNCYIYVYEVDGVVRYVGRGRGQRMEQHIKEVRKRALCTARGDPVKPHRFYDRLHTAIEVGAVVGTRKIFGDLTGDDARIREMEEISRYPREQLWNTVYSDRPRVSDAEFLQRKSAALKVSWANPEHRANWETGLRKPEIRAAAATKTQEQMRNPERRAQLSASTTALWNDPVYREKMAATRTTEASKARRIAASKANWSNPEVRERMEPRVKAAAADPGRRAKVAAAVKQHMEAPERRAISAAVMKALHADPEWRARSRAGIAAALGTPAVRAKMSASAKARWARQNGK